MSCECCWEAFSFLKYERPGLVYSQVTAEHQERGCVCSKNTPEGAKARAGQFWDEEKQRDSREPAPVPEETKP